MVSRSTAWPEGTPCWVDLVVGDVRKAAEFYRDLFGWQVEFGPPETGGYAMCRKDGGAVAGIAQAQDQPVGWTTYLAVEDADKTAGRITEAGGHVLADPFDVGDFGRMAVATDTEGALFGIWQAGRHIGTELANEDATVVWNERLGPDLDGAKRFYTAVFAYTYDDVPGVDPTEPYAIVRADGRSVGGMGPGTAPASWQTYFQVPDADAAVLRVGEVGGTLIRPATDSEYGRIAVVVDDQGAAFALVQDTSAS